MPRLKIPDEPRQQGYANSVRKDTVKNKKKRKAKQPPPPPLGSDRASESTMIIPTNDSHSMMSMTVERGLRLLNAPILALNASL